MSGCWAPVKVLEPRLQTIGLAHIHWWLQLVSGRVQSRVGAADCLHVRLPRFLQENDLYMTLCTLTSAAYDPKSARGSSAALRWRSGYRCRSASSKKPGCCGSALCSTALAASQSLHRMMTNSRITVCASRYASQGVLHAAPDQQRAAPMKEALTHPQSRTSCSPCGSSQHHVDHPGTCRYAATALGAGSTCSS